ncbi:dopamine receptor D4 [Mycolicibacterium sp. P1-5]|nr:dopamine receptor D4 [Mycolicibacterium sp. P1-5]
MAAADPADPATPTAAAGDTSTPPASAPALVPVQHLSSPDNLPPGTTSTDTPPQGRLGYWRDLLHAMRTQQVSGGDALLLLTQRPLDANAAPPPGMSSTPTGPVGTSAVPPAAAPPAADAVAAPAG